MTRIAARAAAVAAVLLTVALVFTSRASAGRRDGAVVVPPPAGSVVLAGAPSEETAVFAGGCFWGVEAVFEHLKGVKSATSGYAGGTLADPSYEQVSQGDTGHAESVRVVFDPSQVSYAQLLHVFFSVAHDPTQLNRQGPDVGTQYRSEIFYTNEAQKRAAESYIAQLTTTKTFDRPIVTRVEPLRAFYEAEAYHQNYLEHHRDQPYIVYNDLPKLEALRARFASLYR